jgi:hypothetical protein
MVDRKLSSSENEESSDVGVLSTNVNEYSRTNSDFENSERMSYLLLLSRRGVRLTKSNG